MKNTKETREILKEVIKLLDKDHDNTINEMNSMKKYEEEYKAAARLAVERGDNETAKEYRNLIQDRERAYKQRIEYANGQLAAWYSIRQILESFEKLAEIHASDDQEVIETTLKVI